MKTGPGNSLGVSSSLFAVILSMEAKGGESWNSKGQGEISTRHDA